MMNCKVAMTAVGSEGIKCFKTEMLLSERDSRNT